ncbi:MAG: hypothetical protein NVSMB58_01310 [Terriglobales bacterium]
MKTTQRIRHLVLTAYQIGLVFYPANFRKQYATELASCAKNMLEENGSPIRVGVVLAIDLSRSLIREHLAMSARLKALPQLAILLTLTTFIAGTGGVVSQQVLRMSANDPQTQLAEDGAQRVSAGENPSTVVSDRKINMATSLAPFVIIYDEAGRPVAASGYLDGSIPTPPKGVFDFVRANRQETLTWQPRHGVRIASVIALTNNGFVVAGRNMREVEYRKGEILKIVTTGWLMANVALIFLWLLSQFVIGSKSERLKVTQEGNAV